MCINSIKYISVCCAPCSNFCVPAGISEYMFKISPHFKEYLYKNFYSYVLSVFKPQSLNLKIPNCAACAIDADICQLSGQSLSSRPFSTLLLCTADDKGIEEYDQGNKDRVSKWVIPVFRLTQQAWQTVHFASRSGLFSVLQSGFFWFCL